MQAIGVEKAHVSGVSSEARLASGSPASIRERIKTLSLDSCGRGADPFLKVIAETGKRSPRASERQERSSGNLPYCFTLALRRPARLYRAQLAAFEREPSETAGRRLLRQSDAVIADDALGKLGKISSTTQITFGRHDTVTSNRFVEPFKSGIKNSERQNFEGGAHAAIYENVGEFNEKTLSVPQV